MQDEIIQAAATLIDAFAANNRNGYFGAFTEDASFIFHNVSYVMATRAAYEAEYDGWVRNAGFEVLECASSHKSVTLHGDTAIFIHQVFTRVLMDGNESAVHERETIVFHKIAGRWLAVHEHLSPLPA